MDLRANSSRPGSRPASRTLPDCAMYFHCLGGFEGVARALLSDEDKSARYFGADSAGLERWLGHFSAAQLFVASFEELRVGNVTRVATRVARWLGLTQAVSFGSGTHLNKGLGGGAPRPKADAALEGALRRASVPGVTRLLRILLDNPTLGTEATRRHVRGWTAD